MRILLALLVLASCGTAPDMSRREARDITRLAIALGPQP